MTFPSSSTMLKVEKEIGTIPLTPFSHRLSLNMYPHELVKWQHNTISPLTIIPLTHSGQKFLKLSHLKYQVLGLKTNKQTKNHFIVFYAPRSVPG